MALRLTHENLPAAYEYLRACESFRKLKLPEADDIGFKVSMDRTCWGWMVRDDKTREVEIAVSAYRVGSSLRLLEVMAHEMIHLHQYLAGRETANTQHNAEFLRLAKSVCAEQVFDLKAFV